MRYAVTSSVYRCHLDLCFHKRNVNYYCFLFPNKVHIGSPSTYVVEEILLLLRHNYVTYFIKLGFLLILITFSTLLSGVAQYLLCDLVQGLAQTFLDTINYCYITNCVRNVYLIL